MCGIYGFYQPGNTNFQDIKPRLEQLISLSYERGKEAAGMAALSEGHQLTLIKSDLDSRKLLKTPEYKRYLDHIASLHVKILTGHSRIATHGTQLKPENNQPVISRNRSIFGVHNGIITNPRVLWDKLSTREEMPELDSQVLFDYLENLLCSMPLQEAVTKLFGEIEGSASIAVALPHWGRFYSPAIPALCTTAMIRPCRRYSLAPKRFSLPPELGLSISFMFLRAQPGYSVGTE